MGLAALMPLWFLPITLDVIELNKQTLLAIVALVGIAAWVTKALIEREFSIARSWLHLVVLFFLIGYGVTSWFSLDRYISFVGNVGQMQWSFLTIASFIAFYFLVANRLKSAQGVQGVIGWFIGGSLLAGIYGILQVFGIYIFGSGNVASSSAFNTVGTVNALATFLAIPTVMAGALSLAECAGRTCFFCRSSKCSVAWKVIFYAMVVVGLAYAVMIDFWVVWAELIFGTVLFAGLTFLRSRKLPPLIRLIAPAAILLVSIIMLFAPSPVASRVPSEVAPSVRHSWLIAQQTLRDRSIFGSGPGTWLFDYAKYRSVAVNVSQFWQLRFERGFSAILTMIAMIGIVGTTLWVMLVGSAGTALGMRLVKGKNEEDWNTYLLLATGWATTVLLAFLYNYNLAHHFAFWLLLALAAGLLSKNVFSWNQSKSWLKGLLSILMIVIAVISVSAMWLLGQRLAGDIQYSKALSAYQKQGDVDASIRHLESATALNKMNDVYYRNLSQAHLVKAGKILEQAQDADAKRKANDHVVLAVDMAKRAVEVGPSNVDNASNLASVYQSIMSFTQGADEYAISAYRQALSLEPNNPIFMNEVGKIYVLRSDAYRTEVENSDQAKREEATKNVAAELEQAAMWFNQSTTAKPDYAAAHFNLGLVYERQGKLPDAIRKLEEVLSVNREDENVAFQLAILYYANNNKEAAQSLFEQIVQKTPSFANARWFLATIYEETGEYDKAIEQIEQVKTTNADNQTVEARLEQLRRGKAVKESPPTASTSTSPVPEPPITTTDGSVPKP
jgi:tetratricopeptide (TPR) repeat protein